jgi:hypothetical protein
MRLCLGRGKWPQQSRPYPVGLAILMGGLVLVTAETPSLAVPGIQKKVYVIKVS